MVYSSKRTLWAHKKKIHGVKKVKAPLVCKFCNKEYEQYKSKWKHEKTCVVKNNKTDLVELLLDNVQDDPNLKNTLTEYFSNKTAKNVNSNSPLTCKFCNKEYEQYKSKWKHEQTCLKRDNKADLVEFLLSNVKDDPNLKNTLIGYFSNKTIKLANYQPPQNTMQPPQNTMQPPQNTMQPPQNTMQPPQNTMQPPQNTMQPPQNTMQPLLNVKIKNKNKNKSTGVPLAVKRIVWDRYIGECIGKSKCYCCKLTDIIQMSFHCGHVISVKNGGPTEIDNLRPICQNCNSSMGTKNMDEFIETYKIHSRIF